MIAKIDKKDMKLLYYLSKDARMPISRVSKLVGLSKNAVKYRIERLKGLGVIKHFACVTNLGSLGYYTITMLLKFNQDIYIDSRIIEYFKNHEFADWVVTLSGKWDIFVEFTCKDFKHFSDIVNNIISYFGGDLNVYQVFTSNETFRVEHLPSDFYSHVDLAQIPVEERTLGVIPIDKKDRLLLYSLNQNSDSSFVSLSARTGLSIDSVRYRFNRLLDHKVLVKCFPEVSLPKLGYTEYLYKIRLKNPLPEKIVSIKKRIMHHGNITYAFGDHNSLSLVFVCAFRDVDQIDHFSREIRHDFLDIIDDEEHMIIKEQVSFNLFPRGLL